MGDSIQAAKAGILEIADVFVVNKADRDGADATARDLRHMMSLVEGRRAEDWQPPIVKTVASRLEGIDQLMAALDKHQEWLMQSGRLDARRRVRAADEIEAIAVAALRTRIGDLHDGTLLDELAGQVVAGETDPYAAADRLLADVTR
jgi:LAO/AO transport system kinase